MSRVAPLRLTAGIALLPIAAWLVDCGGNDIVGATDAAGAKVVDPGWGKKRSIYTEDVAATMYSALGIDWSKTITETPSGRAFQYLEPVSGTTFFDVGEIEPLFI